MRPATFEMKKLTFENFAKLIDTHQMFLFDPVTPKVVPIKVAINDGIAITAMEQGNTCPYLENNRGTMYISVADLGELKGYQIFQVSDGNASICTIGYNPGF